MIFAQNACSFMVLRMLCERLRASLVAAGASRQTEPFLKKQYRSAFRRFRCMPVRHPTAESATVLKTFPLYRWPVTSDRDRRSPAPGCLDKFLRRLAGTNEPLSCLHSRPKCIPLSNFIVWGDYESNFVPRSWCGWWCFCCPDTSLGSRRTQFVMVASRAEQIARVDIIHAISQRQPAFKASNRPPLQILQ